MSFTKVAVIGAAGKTGLSIINGLLAAGTFEITAFARPSSIEKPKNQDLVSKGVKVVPAGLTGSHEALVAALKGIDVVVSAIGWESQADQIPLADAAKEAGVKRFSPCGYVTIAPPTGVMWLRDIKEPVYNHIKKIGLPYTIIDVGWWYQIAYPQLPSGKSDYAGQTFISTLIGDGNTPSALTDLDDIGHYVARIIGDERTLNKYVLAYNEVWKPNDVFNLLEQKSGEKIPRNYVNEEALQKQQAEAISKIEKDSSDIMALYQRFGAEYQLSWGTRGDNTPEYAKYLGYITSKELYPDLKYRTLDTFFDDLLAGKGKNAFA